MDAELKALRQAEDNFKLSIASALGHWCEDNEYDQPRVRLAKELDIDENIFKRILAGSSIATNLVPYAKLYKRTGLSQLDPRKAPPKHFRLPNDQVTVKIRAWSDVQWLEWLNQNSSEVAQKIKSTAAEKRPNPQRPKPDALSEASSEHKQLRRRSPPSDTSDSDQAAISAGSLLDELLAQVARQITQPILQILGDIQSQLAELSLPASAASAIPDEENDSDIERQLIHLAMILESIVGSTYETREEFAAEHRQSLIRLVKVADPLTRESQQREDELSLSRKVKL